MKTCQRIRVAGGICGRLTPNADAWCRHDDCSGYRAEQRPAQPDGRRIYPALVIPQKWRTDERVPLDPDEAYDIRITARAVGEFTAVHGGTAKAAEAELRSMLEDFLRVAKVGRDGGGYWMLLHKGYRCMLAPDCSAMTRYDTAHGERSWSLFKAKVPSRFPGWSAVRRRERLRAGDAVGEGAVL